MSDGHERRRYPRYETHGLEGTLGGRSCEVVKLGLGGILARMEWEPPLESEQPLEMNLGGNHVRCDGRVVFVGRDLAPGRIQYRVGVEFVDSGSGDTLVLQRYLDESLASDEG